MRERMTYETEDKWRADMTFHLVQLIAQARHVAEELNSTGRGPLALADVAAMADAAEALGKLSPEDRKNIQPRPEVLTQAGMF